MHPPNNNWRLWLRLFKANKLPVTEQSLDISAWPEIAKLMGKVKTLLDMAPGFAVVDSFNIEELSNETTKAKFWALGGCIGRHVAQRWDGSILYDVCDTSQTFGYGVRGLHTAMELVFTQVTCQACRFLMWSAFCVYTQPRKAVSVGFTVFITYITVY
jgi:hypothetical protein